MKNYLDTMSYRPLSKEEEDEVALTIIMVLILLITGIIRFVDHISTPTLYITMASTITLYSFSLFWNHKRHIRLKIDKKVKKLLKYRLLMFETRDLDKKHHYALKALLLISELKESPNYRLIRKHHPSYREIKLEVILYKKVIYFLDYMKKANKQKFLKNPLHEHHFLKLALFELESQQVNNEVLKFLNKKIKQEFTIEDIKARIRYLEKKQLTQAPFPTSKIPLETKEKNSNQDFLTDSPTDTLTLNHQTFSYFDETFKRETELLSLNIDKFFPQHKRYKQLFDVLTKSYKKLKKNYLFIIENYPERDIEKETKQLEEQIQKIFKFTQKLNAQFLNMYTKNLDETEILKELEYFLDLLHAQNEL